MLKFARKKWLWDLQLSFEMTYSRENFNLTTTPILFQYALKEAEIVLTV